MSHISKGCKLLSLRRILVAFVEIDIAYHISSHLPTHIGTGNICYSAFIIVVNISKH